MGNASKGSSNHLAIGRSKDVPGTSPQRRSSLDGGKKKKKKKKKNKREGTLGSKNLKPLSSWGML